MNSKAKTAAERMRTSRERRRDGYRVVPLEVKDDEIDGLVACGFLKSDHRADRDAIASAVGTLFDRFPPSRWTELIRPE